MFQPVSLVVGRPVISAQRLAILDGAATLEDVRSARDPYQPPATGREWEPGGRASDVPIVPGGTPNPLEAKQSNDDQPIGNGHDPNDLDDPADAGKLSPDRNALLQFVALMFKNADPRGYVSLRAFRDNDKRDEGPILIEAIRLNDPDFAAVLLERARQAATWDDPAVFCPPVATFQNHQNAKTDNLFEGPDLSTECDQIPLAARSRSKPCSAPRPCVRRERRRMDEPRDR